jgi:hypothetical protein
MARKATPKFNEKDLTKGQLRKLTALRKSVGEDIGNKAFQDWLGSQSKAPKVAVDKNAEMITDTLNGLVKSKGLRIPRGGYLVTRGRGRVIVTRVKGG